MGDEMEAQLHTEPVRCGSTSFRREVYPDILQFNDREGIDLYVGKVMARVSLILNFLSL
jgi:hypothetical protein